MKEFIIGAPYTTRTEIGADNPYLILACDGVSFPPPPLFSFINY